MPAAILVVYVVVQVNPSEVNNFIDGIVGVYSTKQKAAARLLNDPQIAKYPKSFKLFEVVVDADGTNMIPVTT